MTFPSSKRAPAASVALALVFVACVALASASASQAQDAPPPTAPKTPSEVLTDILASACRLNESQFSTHLAGENTAAFRALTPDQRLKVMARLSLSDQPGKPLLVNGKGGQPAMRCTGPGATVEYQLGEPRVHENLAFIPVSVADGADADFGLIRETGGWHLLSIGLVLFDIPQLAKQWAVADAAAREDAVVQDLRNLSEAIKRYYRVFGAMPESLAVLGPAPKDQVSTELASLVDQDMAAGKKDGYAFRYRIVPDKSGNDTAFELAATPQKYPDTGKRSFYMDSSSKVHGDDKKGAVATYEDPLIDGEKSE
jgi:hypothetical protein